MALTPKIGRSGPRTNIRGKWAVIGWSGGYFTSAAHLDVRESPGGQWTPAGAAPRRSA